MLIRVADDYGFKIKTFQHVLEGYKVAKEIAAHGAGGSTFSDWWAYKVEAFDAIPYNADIMQKYGVVVSLNSDDAELMRRLNTEAGEDDEVRRHEPRRSAGDGHHESGDPVGRAGSRGIDRGRQGRRHRDLRQGSAVGILESPEGADRRQEVFRSRFGCQRPSDAGSREEEIEDKEKAEADAQKKQGARWKETAMRTQESGVRGQGSAMRTVTFLGAALLFAAGLFAADAGNSFFLKNADVYPVTGPMIKGASILVQDGKIVDIGTKLVAPKGVNVIDAHGSRVYPGLIDSGTELGLSEISAERVSVDTAEIGEFMPQLRALIAVNPESEHLGVVRVNGITSAMSFPSRFAAAVVAGAAVGRRNTFPDRQP